MFGFGPFAIALEQIVPPILEAVAEENGQAVSTAPAAAAPAQGQPGNESFADVAREFVQELTGAGQPLPPPAPGPTPMGPDDVRQLVTETLRDELPGQLSAALREFMHELRAASATPAPAAPAAAAPTPAADVQDPPPPAAEGDAPA